MSIAVIKTGGKQYKVAKDQILNIEKILGEPGEKIKFDSVLLKSDDKGTKVEIGQPFLEGQVVEAEVIEQGRAKKVHVMKFKRKIRYKRNVGHRQPFTKVKITKV